MVLTCNPDPDWFALEWIKPYLTEDGTPDLSKDGVVRYYVIDNNEYIWASNREELEEIYGSGTDSGIKSFSFVSANCMDNRPLMKNNPSYISELKSKPHVDVQRYLYGNWFVRQSTSGFFNRSWIKEIPCITEKIISTVRSFDFAGTLKSDSNPSPDYTVSVKMSKTESGMYVVEDVKRIRIRFGDWDEFVLSCAKEDPKNTIYVIPQDPGVAARRATTEQVKRLIEAGLYVKKIDTNSSKLTRFRPFSAMAQNEGVEFVMDCGNDLENNIFNDNNFIYKELEAFTGDRKRGENGHDDICDGLSDAFYILATNTQNFGSITGSLTSFTDSMKVKPGII